MKTNFSRKVASKLSPADLWRQIASAIQDSAGHPFWPTDLEKSKSDRFRTNGLIHVTYKGFLGSRPVTYRIIHLNNEQHLLRYESTGDHPLDGGATVKITRGTKGGSELQWSGSYSYPWYSPMGAFLPYFLNRFFAKLRSNLRDFESEKKYRQEFAKVHDLEEKRARRREASAR
jgi:hypothetical protein